MTVGTLSPDEKNLYNIVFAIRQLQEGRSNATTREVLSATRTYYVRADVNDELAHVEMPSDLLDGLWVKVLPLQNSSKRLLRHKERAGKTVAKYLNATRVACELIDVCIVFGVDAARVEE
jgi:hypothetical protein